MAKMSKSDFDKFVKENADNPAVKIAVEQLEDNQESDHQEPISTKIIESKDLGGFPDYSKAIDTSDEFGSFTMK